jgi:hypothetical protein
MRRVTIESAPGPQAGARLVHKPKHKTNIEVLQAPVLAGQKWLWHGFSGRTGGVSTLDGQRVLNLGYVEWDQAAHVAVNRGLFLAAFARSARAAAKLRVVTLKQIHSDAIHAVDAPPAQPLKGDALLTATAGLVLAVQTADCIPILLADPKRRVVAAVHAGWRGTLARIAMKTVGRMQMLYGTKPADVHAALGPGVGRCCYAVGLEVVQKFNAQFAAARPWFDGPFDRLVCDDSPNPLQWLNQMPPGHQPPPPTANLDLAAANRWQLLDAGLRPRHISTSGLCTACRTDLLFSHRAEHGHTGRMFGAIAIKPAR